MFANPHHESAYQLSKEGKLEAALEEFKKALEQNPYSADIVSDRGVAYIHLNKKEEALADFNRAVEMQPDYSFRYSARAYALDFFGNTEDAVKDYEKAIELDPKDAVAYNNLGMLQEKLGYKKMAEANFERADKLSKIENDFLHLMDELEESEAPKLSESTIEHKTISPEETRDTQVSASGEFKKLFTSKDQFKSFLNFLKNGFRIK